MIVKVECVGLGVSHAETFTIRKGERMKKAKIYISPMEREYINKYKEREDTTRIKLEEKGVPNDVICEVIQLRMDNIFLRGKLKEKTDMLTSIGLNPFENAT